MNIKITKFWDTIVKDWDVGEGDKDSFWNIIESSLDEAYTNGCNDNARNEDSKWNWIEKEFQKESEEMLSSTAIDLVQEARNR